MPQATMGHAMSLGLTALELARIQFAFTVSFHIIFPATSIGLACSLHCWNGNGCGHKTLFTKIYSNTGLKFLLLHLLWVLFQALSWPTSLVPTGVSSRVSQGVWTGHYSPMRF